MRTKLMGTLALSMMLFGAGCATTPNTAQTQLQIRAYQTRTYDTTDTKMLLKAVANVLQDEGYIIKNANTDLGLITATRESDVQNNGEAFAAVFFAGANARWKKASIVEATANISDFGKQSRVRVNFVSKVLDNRGGIVNVKPIGEEKSYQDFFAKVEKGVFIQKEKL